jgi:hypothetical protein
MAGLPGWAGTGLLAVVAPYLMREVVYPVVYEAARQAAGTSKPFAVPSTAGNGCEDACVADHGGPRQLATLWWPRVR